MFSSSKHSCDSPTYSSRPLKRPRHHEDLFVLHKAQYKSPATQHEVLALEQPAALRSANSTTDDATLLERVSLSNTLNDVANHYIVRDLHHPHESPSRPPAMISTSHRYSPYPRYKPPRHPSSRFMLSTLDNHSQPCDPSICGISDVYNFPYGPSIYETNPLPTSWKHIPTAAQSNWGFPFRSSSPCSEDSMIVTPVSEYEQHKPFIQGEEENGAFVQQAPVDSWQTLCSQDEKRSHEGPAAQPVQLCLDISRAAQRCGYDALQESVSDLYNLLQMRHGDLTPSTSTSPSCSFATTYPQFVSPFSDSAVTSMPQTHPLYAPRPVRPIPKACFAAPEEDSLPTTSILFQAVSDLVKQACWSGIPGT